MISFSIKENNDFKTTNWSGGTTTQLFIYPEEATLADRNFEFRISTATVEDATSTFTKFNGYTRHITTLDRTVVLKHEGQYEKTIDPFTIDTFSGDWDTFCTGNCTDFNLMYSKNWTGKLEPIYTAKAIPLTAAGFVFIYSLIDNLKFSITQLDDSVAVGLLENKNLLTVQSVNHEIANINIKGDSSFDLPIALVIALKPVNN